MRIDKGYELIVKEAESLGWPVSFKDDLYKIDRACLLEEKLGIANITDDKNVNGVISCVNFAPQFCWVIRPNGTHLLRLDSDDDGLVDLKRVKDWLKAILYCFNLYEIGLYFFDGDKLNRCKTVDEFYSLVEMALAAREKVIKPTFEGFILEDPKSKKPYIQPSQFVCAIRVGSSKAAIICENLNNEIYGSAFEVCKEAKNDFYAIYSKPNVYHSQSMIQRARDYIQRYYNYLVICK